MRFVSGVFFIVVVVIATYVVGCPSKSGDTAKDAGAPVSVPASAPAIDAGAPSSVPAASDAGSVAPVAPSDAGPKTGRYPTVTSFEGDIVVVSTR